MCNKTKVSSEDSPQLSRCKISSLNNSLIMVLLDNDSFILQLEKYANQVRSNSSFTVTFKRYNGHDRPVPREGQLPEPDCYMCLVRAKIKSKKLSTIINEEDVPKMTLIYARFMKMKMDGLKRVKKPKSRTKATAHN